MGSRLVRSKPKWEGTSSSSPGPGARVNRKILVGMFRNKILVRAKPPISSSSSPFLLLHLRLDLPPSSPSPSLSPISDPGPSADPSLFVKLETLCWKLSRAWRVACLCFSHSPDISIVYQRSQSESVGQVVKELVKQMPVGNVGPAEVASGSLVVKALECALRCAFLDSGWRCLGTSLFVDSDFSFDDERSYLCALDVRVQLEMDDGFIFLVSPDVVHFSRYKIADLLSARMEPNFYNGQEVILESHNSVKLCYVLPSLCEGYMIGLGKVPPLREDLGQLEDLWSTKHGLALPNDYFMKIHFAFGGQANKKWLPSAFVLQGSSLAPAPQTARVMKAVSALDSFMKIVEGWNFFGQGWPILQDVSSFNIGSELFTWTKAADAVKVYVSRDTTHPSTNGTISTKMSIPTDLLSANDFRTPKPATCIVGYTRLEDTASLEDVSRSASKISLNDSSAHAQDVPPLISASKLRALVGDHIASKKRISLGDGIASSTKVGNKVCKSCPPSGSLEKTTGTGNEEGHTSAEAYVNDKQHGVIAAEADGINPQTTFKDSGENAGKAKSMVEIKSRNSLEKQKSKVILRNSPLMRTTQGRALGSLIEVHDKDVKDDKENITKKKPKIQFDLSDITMKVINYHARGQLESLTVAELKCFLTSKKAKVGGRKEDLIRRITALF